MASFDDETLWHGLNGSSIRYVVFCKPDTYSHNLQHVIKTPLTSCRSALGKWAACSATANRVSCHGFRTEGMKGTLDISRLHGMIINIINISKIC